MAEESKEKSMIQKGTGLIAIPHMGTVPTQFMQCFCYLMTTFHECGAPHTMWIAYHWTHIARETAAKNCLDLGYEWLFFIDSDMTFPHDTLKRLLAHNLPIVSGLAFKRQWPTRPTIYLADENMDEIRNLVEWEPLQKIDAAGCACLLIRREVFEKIPQPWFGLSEWGAAEDISFFARVKKAGIPVYADTTIPIGHVGQYEFGLEDFERAKKLGLFEDLSKIKDTPGTKVTHL